MPFIPAPLCYRIEVQALLDGQECENVFYVQAEDALGPASMQAVAEDVCDWVNTTYKTVVCTNWVFVGVKVTDLTTAGAPTYFSNLHAGVTGTEASPLPNNVSFAVHKATAGRGRSAQGRTYVPSVPSAAKASTNTVTTLYGNDVCTALMALKTAVEASVAGNLLGILSFFTGGAPRAAGLFTEILSFVCRDYVLDSQRRRLPLRGR